MPRPRCLYCNAELRPETRTVERDATDADYLRRKDANDRAAKYHAEREVALRAGDTDEALRLAKRASGTRRKAPHIYVNNESRLVARVEIPTGHYGRDGNDSFCTRRCGEAFGISAAKAGYRIRSTERLNNGNKD